jgi:hypothetical protein
MRPRVGERQGRQQDRGFEVAPKDGNRCLDIESRVYVGYGKKSSISPDNKGCFFGLVY